MEETWPLAVESFNATVQTFRDLIEGAIEYKPLVDAIYIGFDMNVSNEIFDGAFYDDLDVTTLETKQSYAIQFLRESALDYESVTNMFRARRDFYSLVNNLYALDWSLDIMFTSITLSLDTSDSSEVRVLVILAESSAQPTP